MTADEQILAVLGRGPTNTTDLADAVGWHPRAIRRRLRRLIRDGYVFSPERGRYRITAAGRAVMQPDDAGRTGADDGRRWRGGP